MTTLQGTFSTYPVPLPPTTASTYPKFPTSTAPLPELRANLGGSKRYPYFTHGDLTSHKSVVFIGGLTNGMGDVPYLPRLGERLAEVGWKL